MIEKMNEHYSMTNPATAYDEEALTTLELVGRTTAKVNEVVESQNNLITETDARMDAQDKYLEDRLPIAVENGVYRHIENGVFDAQIDKYLGGIEQRMDDVKSDINIVGSEVDVLDGRLETLLGSLVTGSTTSDAELIDLRTDPDGQKHSSAGDSLRSYLKPHVNYITEGDLDNFKTPMIGLVAGGVTNNPFGLSILIVEHTSTAPSNSKWVLQKLYGTGVKKSAWRVLGVTDWITGQDKDWVNFINGGDLNTYLDKDLYAVVTASVNQPENGVGVFEVQRHKAGASGGTWTIHKWFGVDSGNMYFRIHDGNTFGNWNKVNGGGGSEPLTAKNVVFLGDSIFGNNQGATGIVKLFSGYTGAICHNFAIGGTRAKKRNGNSGWEMFDGESLATSILKGDFSDQTEALERMDNELYYFADTVTAMSEFDFTTADYIICTYGTNDWTGGENTEEYIKAMETIMEKLHKACPNAVIIKVTPTQRWRTDDDANYLSGNVYKDPISGLTLKAFVDADMSLIETHNMQVVDLFNIGINEWTKDHFFNAPDYTHHNSNGTKRIAMYLAGQIR